MNVGVLIGQAISIGFGAYIVALVVWSTTKMIQGLAEGLLKS